jgi:hypothetical protein
VARREADADASHLPRAESRQQPRQTQEIHLALGVVNLQRITARHDRAGSQRESIRKGGLDEAAKVY